MQNRLVLFDLSPDVPRLANSADALKDLLELNACWVDRFAFLRPPQKKGGAVVAAAELHLENVRDLAVKKLDGMLVTMDENGNIISTCDADCAGTDVHVCSKESGREITFRMQAAPATASQSRRLVELSPLEEDVGERIQTLHLPREVHLTVARSTIGGGTGADPWRGGILLARLICSWVDECQKLPSLRELFHDKDILELGAGSSGLPSMAVASLEVAREGDAIVPSSIVATDGVDEIIDVLTQNVARNGLSNSLDTQFLDWNHLPSVSRRAADVILFSDCIYNEAGADALSNAIEYILRPGGSVLGVLPDMRVGLSRFESNMKKCGFAPQDVPLSKSSDNISGHGSNESFLCSGGGTKNYRIVFWDDRTVERGR